MNVEPSDVQKKVLHIPVFLACAAYCGADQPPQAVLGKACVSSEDTIETQSLLGIVA